MFAARNMTFAKASLLGGGTDFENYIAAQDADSPVLRWRLQETTGVTAVEDIVGNNGTYFLNSGGAWTSGTLGTSGLIAGSVAADFNGSTGLVNCGDRSEVDFGAGDFTLEAIIKPDAVAGREFHILSKDSSFANRQFALSIQGGNTLQFVVFQTDASYVVGRYDGIPMTVGNTFHIVAVRKSLSMEIWVNGVSQSVSYGLSTAGFPITMQSTNAILSVGYRDYASFQDWFDGKILAPTIYGSALSAARIVAHFEAASGYTMGWETPVDVSTVGDSIVSTAGTLITAISWGQGLNHTANGVTFLGDIVPDGGFTQYVDHLLYQSGGIGAGFEAIMDALAYSAGSDTITLTGLTAGKIFLFQVFVADDRGVTAGRTQYFNIGSYTSETKLQSSTSSFICRFVATGPTQVVNLVAVAGPSVIINGHQLRQLD